MYTCTKRIHGLSVDQPLINHRSTGDRLLINTQLTPRLTLVWDNQLRVA